MKNFIVTGEYGIQEGQYIRMALKAKNEVNARKNFINKLKDYNTTLINNIKNNITVVEKG